MSEANAEAAGARTCPNCRSYVVGPYCSQCGQPKNIHRRSVVKLVHEFLADIISFDSRILHTAWALMALPGELSVAFRQGRAQRYVPAVRLYLFVSLFFFLILSAGHIAIMQLTFDAAHTSDALLVTKAQQTAVAQHLSLKGNADKMPIAKNSVANGSNADTDPDKDDGPGPKIRTVFFAPIGSVKSNMTAAERKSVEADLSSNKIDIRSTDGKTRKNFHDIFAHLTEDPAALNGPLTEWIPKALFALLPVFALLLALFYRRQRAEYYLVDHLVFSLNYHSFAFVWVLLVVGVKQTFVGDRALSVLLPGLGIYLLLAIRRFYRQNWFKCVTKSILVAGFYAFFLCVAAVTVLIMGVIDA